MYKKDCNGTGRTYIYYLNDGTTEEVSWFDCDEYENNNRDYLILDSSFIIPETICND